MFDVFKVSRFTDYDLYFLLRTTFELILAFLAVKYLTSTNVKPKIDSEDLTTKEKQELIDEWKPESLVPEHLSGDEEEGMSVDIDLRQLSAIDDECKQDIEKAALQVLAKYGVGTCGPPGFYGTLDIHLKLEDKLAEFFGTECAILYTQGMAAATSVIPAFSKRGDVIVHDECVHYALLAGMKISRSYVYSFKHNDYRDLQVVLEEITKKHGKNKQARKFILVESLYYNVGDACNIGEVLKLKSRFNYRLIVDVTAGLGLYGPQGLGLGDHLPFKPSDIDIIVGSLANGVAAAGGFCTGSKAIVEHQRLLSNAYVFSASLPAILSEAAIISLNYLQKRPLKNMDNVNSVIGHFVGKAHKVVIISGRTDSPIIVVRAKCDSYEGRRKTLQRVYNLFRQRKITVAFVNGTMMERKMTMFPLIRLVLHSTLHQTDLNTVKDALQEISEL